MNISFKSIPIIAILLTGFLSLSTPASADLTAPFLYFGGNYQYDAGTHSLTFSNNYADLVEYFDGSFAYRSGEDPIVGATLSFGAMSNSDADPLVIGSSTLTVAGYFTATLGGLLANNTSEAWGSLSDIVRLDNGSSNFVSELIYFSGNGGGIYMNFTPQAGGIESLTASSSGAVGGIVAASPVPVPPSAVLFASGLASLAFSRRKRISGR